MNNSPVTVKGVYHHARYSSIGCSHDEGRTPDQRCTKSSQRDPDQSYVARQPHPVQTLSRSSHRQPAQGSYEQQRARRTKVKNSSQVRQVHENHFLLQRVPGILMQKRKYGMFKGRMIGNVGTADVHLCSTGVPESTQNQSIGQCSQDSDDGKSTSHPRTTHCCRRRMFTAIIQCVRLCGHFIFPINGGEHREFCSRLLGEKMSS